MVVATLKWNRTEDGLPCGPHGGQVTVLFGNPEWACPIYGLYSRLDDGPGEWWEYDQSNDKFHDIRLGDGFAPKLWLAVPSMSD